MGLNASQIRRDFNCFGGFGQQGYGYKLKKLKDELIKILDWIRLIVARSWKWEHRSCVVVI